MTDGEQIRATIQTYFDCMYESSAAKAHAAFHENAKITGYLPNGLAQMSVTDFADFVASQPSGKDAGETAFLEVVSLDIAGKTAIARVRDDYLGNRFLDTLSFLNENDEWRIYNKLFHVEGKAGAD
ncbi:MAG: nuclear transport factor 2 family protein [Pseudomonadales bacterium]|nr:nuclear transport factor 2 family protein [Pseudomonadales bacterium]